MSSDGESANSALFSAESSRETLRAACATVGLDSSGARLMRLGENALFHLPDDGIVVRIARTMEYWPDAVKEVNVAHWLAENRFPAAQVCEITQPVSVDDRPVTFWHFIDGRSGERRDVADLGVVLRKLHSIPPPVEFSLPPQDALGRVLPRIVKSDIPADDKEFLASRFDELQRAIPQLHYPLAPTSTHGDAHIKNLMYRDRQPILIDFERFSRGQPEWDLAMTATEYLSAGWWTDEEYGQFADAYGYDITTWTDGFPVLRAVHEIKMTTWIMQNVAESPEIADEYRTRIRALRGEPSPGWRPF